MPRRKTHKPPAEFQYKLIRYLEFCKSAAWELSQSPWLRTQPKKRAGYLELFHGICRLQKKNYELLKEEKEDAEHSV